MYTVSTRLNLYRIVPVIRLDTPEDAPPLAEALCDGGLPVAEITFRTEAAEESLRILRRRYPDMLLGAGTVLSACQADAAAAVGADFIVSPGFSPKVVEHCLSKGYPVYPGVCTPTEVEAALGYGLTELKFFPAEAAGGLAMIRALSAPYPSVRFMPTGGLHPQNVGTYLACPAVFACGGSWMAPDSMIRAG